MGGSNYISIHALLAESDLHKRVIFAQWADFYPRSPCGERPRRGGQASASANFYPRSPCGERHEWDRLLPVSHYFYPRSPCGERPLESWPDREMRKISIHALLAESDRFLPFGPMTRQYFYPRSPCGERQPTARRNNQHNVFLSTLSLRRATWPGLLARPFFIISIHALLAESDYGT